MTPSQLNPKSDLSHVLNQLVLEADAAKRQRLYRKVARRLELIRSLKAEVDHYKDKDSARALHLSNCALELSKVTDHPEAKPLGLWAYALGLTVNGYFDKALTYFDQARSLYQVRGQEGEAARVAMRQIQALAMTGAFEEAVSLAESTRDTLHYCGYQHDALTVENNIGIIYIRLGQFAQAEKVLERALAGFCAAEDEAGKLLVYINLGDVYQKQDKFFRAERCLKWALELAQRLEQPKHVAGITVNLALLYRGMGRHHEALKLLTRVRNLYEGLPAGPDAALAQLEEARIHLDVNLLSEAESIAAELVEVFGLKEMTLEQTEALQVLGLAQARQGELAAATKTLGAARQQWCAMGNCVQTALTELSIASLHLELKEFARAQGLAEKAVSDLEEVGTRSGQVQGYLLCATIHLAQKRTLKAHAYLAQAEQQEAELNVPELSFRTFYLKGKLALEQNRVRQAKAYFERAIAYLEGVHGALPVADFRAAYMGDKLAVYEDLIALLAEESDWEGVFNCLERAKARVLLDLLGDDVDASNSDPHIIDTKVKLEQARAALNVHTSGAETNPERLACERKVTRLLRELERFKPEATPLDMNRIPRLSDLQAQLEAHTVWVTYFCQNGLFSALVITRTDVRYVQSLAPESEVGEALEWLEFYFSRAALGDAFIKAYGEERLAVLTHQPLRVLYDMLIAPLRLEGAAQLIISPQGSLYNVPFVALFDAQEYLGDRCHITLTPSASVYFHCIRQAKAPSKSLCAFGVGQDLPSVHTELAAVGACAEDAELYLDAEATLATFLTKAPRAEVVHIAAHGDFRPDNPSFSSLYLQDGGISARDLYETKLQASLVVLSACHSGRVSRFHGDELAGLARGFLDAGARSLVSALWPTKDAQTAQFMGYFYEGLSEALSIAEALHRAQRSLREHHPNPYFWAAFSVMGYSGQSLNFNAPL